MQVRAPNITSGSAAVANDTRVAAISISVYDYILTLSAEYRFYRAFHRNNFRLSTNLVLFVLIRYTSVCLLVLGAVGYWSTFSPESCRAFYLIPISARVIQSMVSQAILGLRSYVISRKHSVVGTVLLSSYIVATAFQWVASIYHRVPVSVNGNCGAVTTGPTLFPSPWLFYLAAMLYDLLTLTISMAYLSKYRLSSPFTSRFVKMMIYDGLGFFVALTVVNTVNAILYRSTDFRVQSAAAPFAFAFTWIMSQRILIHLHDASEKRRSPSRPPAVRPLILPPQSKAQDTDSSFMGSSCISNEPLQVHVERSVVVGVGEPTSASFDESSRTPAVKWSEGLVVSQ